MTPFNMERFENGDVALDREGRRVKYIRYYLGIDGRTYVEYTVEGLGEIRVTDYALRSTSRFWAMDELITEVPKQKHDPFDLTRFVAGESAVTHTGSVIVFRGLSEEYDRMTRRGYITVGFGKPDYPEQCFYTRLHDCYAAWTMLEKAPATDLVKALDDYQIEFVPDPNTTHIEMVQDTTWGTTPEPEYKPRLTIQQLLDDALSKIV